MKTSVRDWMWQTIGLLIGVFPAILAVYVLPVGLLLYLVACLGFVHPRTRSFTFGFVCAILTLPGLAAGAVLF